jgi:hypothetical protein
MMIDTSFVKKKILDRLKPDWVVQKFWSMVIGVLVVAGMITLPWIDWLFKLAVILFGLGALRIYRWEILPGQPVAGKRLHHFCGASHCSPFYC